MTNNERNQALDEIEIYTHGARNCGRTQLMIEGIRNFPPGKKCIVVANSLDYAKGIVRQAGRCAPDVVAIGMNEVAAGALRGKRDPIALDHTALEALFNRTAETEPTEWPAGMESYLTKVEYVKKKKVPWYEKIFNWIWRI